MNKIEQLLAKHCPQGVKFAKIGSHLNVFNGYAFDSSFFNTEENGIALIRIRDVNTGFSSTYYSGPFENKFLVSNGDLLIGMDGDFRITRWQHGKALLNQRVCRLENFEGVIPSYIYYHMHSELEKIQKASNSGTVNHLSSKQISEIVIPVPPLEIQKEIVSILDTFTELEAELEAELKGRKKQYEFYRNRLLSFTDVEEGGVRWIPMGDLAEIGTGSRNTQDGKQTGEYPFYVRSQTPMRLDHFDFEDASILTAGDGVGVGKVFHYVEGKYALHQRCYRINFKSNEVLPKFAFYFIRHNFAEYLATTAVFGSVSSLRKPMFENYNFPIISLEKQAEIVVILDNFETLVADISSGLPAEIAARRKQYEYYRNKLLTFKELKAS